MRWTAALDAAAVALGGGPPVRARPTGEAWWTPSRLRRAATRATPSGPLAPPCCGITASRSRSTGRLAMLVAWTAGSARAAVALRRTLAPVMREWPDPCVVVTIAFSFFLLWGPTRAAVSRRPGAHCIRRRGVEALRRQTLRKFPSPPARARPPRGEDAPQAPVIAADEGRVAYPASAPRRAHGRALPAWP